MPKCRAPRPNPCASCPYRRDVPSGIWSAEEYAKLPAYDGEITEQAAAGAFALFDCHQTDGSLCAGWVGHRTEPADLLAVRVGLADGRVDPDVGEYRTDVPLFASGAEAAAHGRSGIADPSAAAVRAISKVVRVRALRGRPVT